MYSNLDLSFHETLPFSRKKLVVEVNSMLEQGLEEDLEKSEDKLLQASQKLDKASTSADDSGTQLSTTVIFDP